jgi:hypothetical protein
VVSLGSASVVGTSGTTTVLSGIVLDWSSGPLDAPQANDPKTKAVKVRPSLNFIGKTAIR